VTEGQTDGQTDEITLQCSLWTRCKNLLQTSSVDCVLTEDVAIVFRWEQMSHAHFREAQCEEMTDNSILSEKYRDAGIPRYFVTSLVVLNN